MGWGREVGFGIGGLELRVWGRSGGVGVKSLGRGGGVGVPGRWGQGGWDRESWV